MLSQSQTEPPSAGPDCTTSPQVWGMWDISFRAPSVAVDVLSAMHVLVEDEHMVMKGKGESGIESQWAS